jgi:3-hydroxy acid dehydrogenase / malonic semialdehyde reductase
MQKTILITGASSGFGYATAELFLRNNWNVIALARRKERLMELNKYASHQQLTIVECDVRDWIEVQNKLFPVLNELETLNALVNNAGLALEKTTVESGNLEAWKTMIDTNIHGLLNVSKLVIPKLKGQKNGLVINISSIAGREAYEGGNVYGATKAAVALLSKSMRIELAPFGVKVTDIAPGAAETEFSLVRFENNFEKAKAVYSGFQPLIGNDIANIIWFLCNLPPHVCIQEMVVMPTSQPEAKVVFRSDQ